MDISVRYADGNDCAACVALDHHLDARQMQRRIAAGQVMVAQRGADILGHLRVGYLWGTRPHIEQIRVSEKHRRLGVGHALLAFLEADQRKQGVRWLLSSCSSDEVEPQTWHLAQGFQPAGVVDLGDERELFLRKQL
jgi:GNAT superfamily N-acetyltransferase